MVYFLKLLQENGRPDDGCAIKCFKNTLCSEYVTENLRISSLFILQPKVEWILRMLK